MDFILGLLSSVGVSAIVSSMGVVISALISKWEAARTAQTEIEKFKMQIDHEDQMRREDFDAARMARITDAYLAMVDAVTAYRNIHDESRKNAAEVSILKLIPVAGETEKIKYLRDVIRSSDPAKGVRTDDLDPALDDVLAEKIEKFGG